MTVAKALTIAGSDSGGGAGIQADLKTFMALGVYGTSVITAVTAQNTLGVQGVVELPSEFVAQQFDSVLSDIGTHAAKTGMLSSIPLVQTVSKKIQEYKLQKLVVDPVMVAKGGHPLLREEARRVLAETLLPLALVVTPNLHEAGLLAGMEVHSRTDMEEAARRIKALGPRYVVVKGGHLETEACDILFDGREFRSYEAIEARDSLHSRCRMYVFCGDHCCAGERTRSPRCRSNRENVCHQSDGCWCSHWGRPCSAESPCWLHAVASSDFSLIFHSFFTLRAL